MDWEQPAGGAASSAAAVMQQAQQQESCHAPPILGETGREGLSQCAMADGSSFVCGRCGGVVSKSRRQQHEMFWCSSGAS